MGEYNPKSKRGLPVSWRGIQRKLPRTLSTFQVVILAGFLSLLLLRSTIGLGKLGGQYKAPGNEYVKNVQNRLLDSNAAVDVEPTKRNLVQTAGAELIERLEKTGHKNALQQMEDEMDAQDAEDLLEVRAATGKDVKNVKEEIRKPADELIGKPVTKSVEKPVEKVVENKKILSKFKEVEAVENFEQVEALLGEEETAEELADFAKFEKGGEEEKKVIITQPKVVVDSAVKKEQKLPTTENFVDKKAAEKETSLERKEDKIEQAVTSKKVNAVQEKKPEEHKFVESKYDEKPTEVKKPEEHKFVESKYEKKPTEEKKSEEHKFVESKYDKKPTEEKKSEEHKFVESKYDKKPTEEKKSEEHKFVESKYDKKHTEEKEVEVSAAVDFIPGIKSSDNDFFEMPPEQLKKFTEQAIANMTKVIGRDKPDAFTLGPKISDWDEQRASWLEKNPDMKSTDPHKPKVLLLTGSQPWPCNSPVGDHYLLKMIKNKVDYTRIHNIEVFYSFAHLDKPMSHFWAKLPLMRKMMLMRPEVEWIFWMDSDAMFTDMVFEIPFEKYQDYNFVMWGWEEGLWERRSWVATNTGVMFLRNNQWTLDLLEKWSHMGPEGQIRNEAGVVMSTYLTTRGEMMADDQSALVFLMLTDPALRPKFYLEDEYMLSGYWVALVGRYEEILKKSRPGAGGRDWPFTTHFTGCQPCSGNNNQLYEGNSCLEGMERAFNFADNQVLRPFGFAHEDLQGAKVLRIRNETAKPVWSVPVNNPWSVQSFYD